MKENQHTLCKKKIFGDTTYSGIKKINSENPPQIRRALQQKNEMLTDNQQTRHDQNNNIIKQQNCAKQQEQSNIIQISKTKGSATRKIFNTTQYHQQNNDENIKTKPIEKIPILKKKFSIFGMNSDRTQPTTKRLLGIEQNHNSHQNNQNQGDTQCTYDEEDSLDEYNLLLKKKQPPSLETAVKITNNLCVFENIVQFLTFEDLLAIKYVCKSFFSHKFQQKIKKKLFMFISQGLTPNQQYLLWDQYIHFSSVQKKYELQYYNYTLIPSPFDKEILKDFDRTHIGDPGSFDGKRKEKLKKILRAISHNVKEVGYIQGLNQIVGSFLVHEIKENDIYWIILYLLKKLRVKEMYKEGFPRLKVLTFQLEIFMQNYLPDLLAYLKSNQISVSYFCTKWFITLFSYELPNQILMKVWNLFLIKGWKVLIRISLGLLKLFEQEIMKEPLDNLSNFIRNFAEQNMEKLNQQKLIETSFSLKVTNRLLVCLQNIYEQHQVFNCSVFNMNIILFQNPIMNNTYDWKILPQAPDFEGQNYTLERLNAHTMVADYINELSCMEMQKQSQKDNRSSSVSKIQQTIKGVKVLNNSNLQKKPSHHQRSLSTTRSPNLTLNQFDFPLVQTNTKMSNNYYINGSHNKQNQHNQDYFNSNRKNQTTTHESEGESLGLFQQIQNKIISMFNDNSTQETDNTNNNISQTQKEKISRTTNISRNNQSIQLLYNKNNNSMNNNPLLIRQSSTPQIFQRTQTKYYDQVLEDFQEIKEENKQDEFQNTEIKIKLQQQQQQEKQTSLTQQFNTVMTDINEFENNYIKPQQNNTKYIILQKPNHIERLNLNQHVKQQQYQINQPSPIQTPTTTFQIPNVIPKQIQDKTNNNFYYQPHSTLAQNNNITLQQNRSPDIRIQNVQYVQQNTIQHVQQNIQPIIQQNIQQIQQNNFIHKQQPSTFQRVIQINQQPVQSQRWTIINPNQ